MIKTLIIQPETIVSMCAVCVSDRSGGQIALAIIVFALVVLGVGNWLWKKYFKTNRQISTEK